MSQPKHHHTKHHHSDRREDTAVTVAPLEWELLVRLPGRILVAAISVEPDSARHTVAEGLAGIEAIAAGRASQSGLVRQVVAAIYAESGSVEEAPAAEEFTDRTAGVANVLAECHAAGRVLADRVAAEDAAAYREWLLAIAMAVCEAARTGGLFGMGGVSVSPAERRFLDDLGGALDG